MDNQIDSAVETEETTSVTTTDVDEEVVIAEDDGKEVDETFTDTDSDETDGDGESESKPEETEEKDSKDKPKQSKEKNKEFAEKRRAEKAKAEEAELKFVKEYVGKNPYTNEPIETLRDVKVYKTMKQIEKNGGDPVQDYHKYAGLEEQKAIDSEKARTENIKKDVEDFRNAYPEANLNDLHKDKEFVEFSNEFIGKVPLKTIYKAFCKVKTNLQATAEETAKKEIARKLAKDNSSAGNLATAGDAGAPKYSLEQIGKMSQSEIDKNWKDVEASYNYWQKYKK
jgi:hypothetical protein